MSAILVLLLATKSLADQENNSNQNNLANNVIYKPNPPSEPKKVVETPQPKPLEGHSIRANNQVSEEALRQYLESKKSPLVSVVGQLRESPYWSTIIGICTIEEYSCSVNPHGTNNLWGLMSRGSLISYPTLGEGLAAIEVFLAKAEANGRTTIESFRGWYCASACTNWESTVIKTKLKVEGL